MDTVEFKVGENTVVFYSRLKHGTQRRVNALVRPHMSLNISKEDSQPLGVSVRPEVELGSLDYDAINDIIILNQVAQWSFGPVNQETLDRIDDDDVNKILIEVNRLYGGQHPLAQTSGGS